MHGTKKKVALSGFLCHTERFSPKLMHANLKNSHEILNCFLAKVQHYMLNMSSRGGVNFEKIGS